ncbi:LPD7 domain-containing protein [Brevundimonas sp.]|uniref:LPD7 domain-containing protein n=1 Tax=Brevundimonas sp. TaxID=1871086 RepID=UPI002896FBD4|nr:LPD7 domain-containing protein [Brevundimonas sp.]
MNARAAGPDAAPGENSLAPTPTRGGPARSRTRGDAPQAILDRYLIERDRQGRPTAFFRDHRAKDPMFRDEGKRLSSDHTYPDTISDMLKIAQHRGWTVVRASGDEAFRREAWIQARALGLEVKGYRPRDRDRQAAGETRLDRSQRNDREQQSDARLHARLRDAAVVVRRLVSDPGVAASLMERALERMRAGRAVETPDRDRQGRDRRS